MAEPSWEWQGSACPSRWMVSVVISAWGPAQSLQGTAQGRGALISISEGLQPPHARRLRQPSAGERAVGPCSLLLWTEEVNSLCSVLHPVLKKSHCWVGALWPRAAVPPWFLHQPFCITHCAPGCGALPPAKDTWTDQAAPSCHPTPCQVSLTTATTVFPGSGW